jgi:hypothetical protein
VLEDRLHALAVCTPIAREPVMEWVVSKHDLATVWLLETKD